MTFAADQAETARSLARDINDHPSFEEPPIAKWTARRREVTNGLLATRKVQEANGVDVERTDDLISRVELVDFTDMDFESTSELFSEVADYYDGE